VLVWIAYAAICLIWGTTWLAIKVGLHAIPPLTGVGLRFFIAGALLYGVAALRREIPAPRTLPWKLIFVLAIFLFAADYSLLYTGETHLDSGLTAVIFGILPFFVFGFSRLMLGERLTGRILIGSLAAFAGVAVISIAGSTRGSLLFALAIVAAAASSSFANVYAKRHASYSPFVTLPPAMVIAGILVLGLGLTTERTDWAHAFTGSSLAALLYLSIFGSGVAFFLLLWVLQRLPASIVGLASLIFPVVAVATGAVFGGEHVTARELAGSALVVAGLWFALSRSKDAAERSDAIEHLLPAGGRETEEQPASLCAAAE
jgi:drug/metabolite transporter (DMT)-like permease